MLVDLDNLSLDRASRHYNEDWKQGIRDLDFWLSAPHVQGPLDHSSRAYWLLQAYVREHYEGTPAYFLLPPEDFPKEDLADIHDPNTFPTPKDIQDYLYVSRSYGNEEDTFTPCQYIGYTCQTYPQTIDFAKGFPPHILFTQKYLKDVFDQRFHEILQQLERSLDEARIDYDPVFNLENLMRLLPDNTTPAWLLCGELAARKLLQAIPNVDLEHGTTLDHVPGRPNISLLICPDQPVLDGQTKEPGVSGTVYYIPKDLGHFQTIMPFTPFVDRTFFEVRSAICALGRMKFKRSSLKLVRRYSWAPQDPQP